MSDISFILPITAYTGFTADSILEAMFSGTSKSDIYTAFQAISGEPSSTDTSGFFYDYIQGMVIRYPELLESINRVRVENGYPPVV